MKLNKIFAAFMLIAAVTFTACEPQVPPTPTPGPGPGGNGTTITEDPTDDPTDDPTNGNTQAPDTAGWNIPAGALTVAQAREICAGLTTGDSTSTEEYYVMGWVKKVKELSTEYGNATFFMEDVKDANSYDDFTAYRVKGMNGEKITNNNAVQVGDFVVIYGKLMNYKGTPENAKNAYIWKSTNQLLAAGGNTGSSDSGDTGNTGNGGTSIDSDIAVPENALVFDADTDNEGIGTDSDNATSYTITKDGVTITVSQGILGGPYKDEMHYRIYKNQSLTITSADGDIKEVVFTCTANGEEKYGPGCFTVSDGSYVYSGANGQWTGSASEIVFTASLNQVRATQIAVVVE